MTTRPTRDQVLAEIKHHINPAIGRNRLREAEGKPYDQDDLARAFDRAADAVLALLDKLPEAETAWDEGNAAGITDADNPYRGED